jgi:hypothetical protein
VTRPPRKYLLVTTVAVLAVLGGLVAPWAYGLVANSSAKDRIAADPPPALFPTSNVASVDRLVVPAQTRARQLLEGWWAGHDRSPHDIEFVSWAEAHFPGPPSSADRAKELAGVQALAKQRTDPGVTAATWLEAYGKKDIWKLYAHDQAEILPTDQGDARKQDVSDLLDMSKQVADDLGAKFQQSAPYVLDPSLRTDHTVAPGDVCPCSYPSRHASAAAASRTFLGTLAPTRTADYRRMEDEVDYSRIYMAGHVPSDISGGALLGDLIGEYFLVTRGFATG